MSNHAHLPDYEDEDGRPPRKKPAPEVEPLWPVIDPDDDYDTPATVLGSDYLPLGDGGYIRRRHLPAE